MSHYRCEPYLAVKFKKLADKNITKTHIGELISEWVSDNRILSSSDYLCDLGAVATINFSDGSVLFINCTEKKLELTLAKIISKAEIFTKTLDTSKTLDDSKIEEAIKYHRSEIKHIISTGKEKTLIVFNDSSVAVINSVGVFILDSINMAFCLIDNFPFKNTLNTRGKPEVH